MRDLVDQHPSLAALASRLDLSLSNVADLAPRLARLESVRIAFSLLGLTLVFRMPQRGDLATAFEERARDIVASATIGINEKM